MPVSSRLLFSILPAVTMSLGWALRGTIGGGPVGAMIPGAMVTLCLCHLLGWNRRTAIAAAFGAIGVGLGGQMTYGQVIGFIREPETVWWGLLGLTTKGAVWGLSGGLLVGLGLMHSRYKREEILFGLLLMTVGTYLGWRFVDLPKLMYFSNRIDKPREEVWFGLLLGAVWLLAFLWCLRREKVSTAIALAGLIGGGLGFGGGGMFNRLGAVLDEPYRSWPWWKVMEFSFGLLYGLSLGIACFRFRGVLAAIDVEDSPPIRTPVARGGMVAILAGLAVACGGLWFQFNFPYRAMFTVAGSCLLGVSLFFPRLAWHVALSMTICGFVRDWLYKSTLPISLALDEFGWAIVFLLAVPIVLVVFAVDRRGRLTAGSALLGLTIAATFFGMIKVGVPDPSGDRHLFIPLVFIAQALLVVVMTMWTPAKRGFDHIPNAPAKM